MLGDKDYKSSVKMMAPYGKRFYTSTPPMPGRTLSAYELAKTIEEENGKIPVFACDSMQQALSEALDGANGDDVLCVFGSLYQVADVRRYFNVPEK